MLPVLQAVRHDHCHAQIMKVVKGLAKKDAITVAATIHSPSPFTFRLFDKVIILLQGRIAYFGNNGRAP